MLLFNLPAIVPFDVFVPVATAPAAPAVLDEAIILLVEEVVPEEPGQEAVVGSFTLALGCTH